MEGDPVMEMCQLADADATRALGRRLAERLLERMERERMADPGGPPEMPPHPPLLVLQGDLGAGKTCLVQGLAEGLGITEPITSPTFALAHHYRGDVVVAARPAGLAFTAPVLDASATVATKSLPKTLPTALVHVDLYRLEQPAAAAELFAQEEEEARALGAVLAVEWPERLSVMPEPCWRVELAFAGEGRLARLFGTGISGDA
jgi:tRNA threonylcarbamoyladenosine biosynthesis protein TsaE